MNHAVFPDNKIFIPDNQMICYWKAFYSTKIRTESDTYEFILAINKLLKYCIIYFNYGSKYIKNIIFVWGSHGRSRIIHSKCVDYVI